VRSLDQDLELWSSWCREGRRGAHVMHVVLALVVISGQREAGWWQKGEGLRAKRSRLEL